MFSSLLQSLAFVRAPYSLNMQCNTDIILIEEAGPYVTPDIPDAVYAEAFHEIIHHHLAMIIREEWALWCRYHQTKNEPKEPKQPQQHEQSLTNRLFSYPPSVSGNRGVSANFIILEGNHDEYFDVRW
jgi:hypothetical protein